MVRKMRKKPWKWDAFIFVALLLSLFLTTRSVEYILFFLLILGINGALLSVLTQWQNFKKNGYRIALRASIYVAFIQYLVAATFSRQFAMVLPFVVNLGLIAVFDILVVRSVFKENWKKTIEVAILWCTAGTAIAYGLAALLLHGAVW